MDAERRPRAGSGAGDGGGAGLPRGISFLVEDSHMELSGAVPESKAKQNFRRVYRALKRQRERRSSAGVGASAAGAPDDGGDGRVAGDSASEAGHPGSEAGLFALSEEECAGGSEGSRSSSVDSAEMSREPPPADGGRGGLAAAVRGRGGGRLSDSPPASAGGPVGAVFGDGGPSFDTEFSAITFNRRGPIHLQSADLLEAFSPLQRTRQHWQPPLPDVFRADDGDADFHEVALVPVAAPELPQPPDAEELRQLMPAIFGQPCLAIVPPESPQPAEPPLDAELPQAAGPAFVAQSAAESGAPAANLSAPAAKPGALSTPASPLLAEGKALAAPAAPAAATRSLSRRPLRIGLVLSGGPAPGGHNVIAGLFDFLKSFHVESRLYGFLGGLDGLFQRRYRIVSGDLMQRFRNQGGFDMLWSGRGRVRGEADKTCAARVCAEFALDGLVIVGGDGSNSNAALLAEYFAGAAPRCVVVGVPKTIDGDLRNPWIETSFGFDTAAKTYSELIGNLCTDVLTGREGYHFVRVMGRSASHLVLECAMQTRPNLVFVGEEVERRNVGLGAIVGEIAGLIEARRAAGLNYGIVLVPEGLIEFIPEMGALVAELNKVIIELGREGVAPAVAAVGSRLSPSALAVWNILPLPFLEQLLDKREASGYVQVAKIATEQLLKALVLDELARRAAPSAAAPPAAAKPAATPAAVAAPAAVVDAALGGEDGSPGETPTAEGSPPRAADSVAGGAGKGARASGGGSPVSIMTHYFGYEGRCAMPSNFDASYCYTLGFTAGHLCRHRRNGYMTVVRHLEQHPSCWQPAAIPFTRIMDVRDAQPGAGGPPRFASVRKQLVDLDGPLFRLIEQVREQWKMGDYYRCPGPIQFEGPVAAAADYTVAVPASPAALLDGESPGVVVGAGRAVSPKRPGCLSELQRQRLQYRPRLPQLCADVHALAVRHSQYLPKDPFTHRQILIHYPRLCHANNFHLSEVESDAQTPSIEPGLRVGVVLLSRQSPGVVNILWGVHERLKLVGGTCVAFYGTEGLMTGRAIQLEDTDLQMYLNQGGMEILGRATKHSLLERENIEAARLTCDRLRLDGLVIVGSSLAVTEAAMTSEHFLERGSRTCVVAIPATGSNNLTHELIETNIGFDTSSKLYASLIGNVLTDAASMPKYWHFIRLMGRQPSYEVLECALQTHPNVCIIAEEYGAANRTLHDVVKDICDVICARAARGKDFGSVLIPDGLLSHLPSIKTLMTELTAVVRDATRKNMLPELQAELARIGRGGEAASGATPGSGGGIGAVAGGSAASLSSASSASSASSDEGHWVSQITPWSRALYASLPPFIQSELTRAEMAEMQYTHLETEKLLQNWVSRELARRKAQGLYKGNFSSICHFFGYQGRSSMPSEFDCTLAFAYGHLAVICVESGLTGHCCTIRGLVGDSVERDWRLGAIPLNSMLSHVATQDDIHPVLKEQKAGVPIIPAAEVNLQGKAYRWLKTAVDQWQHQDRFCNPGPVQFGGEAAHFFHRLLHEEQAEYFAMLKHVQAYAAMLKRTCTFGVDERYLKEVFCSLYSLLVQRKHPYDLMHFLPQLGTADEFERQEAKRPDVWARQGPGTAAGGAPGRGSSRALLQHSMSGLVEKRLHSSTAVDRGAGSRRESGAAIETILEHSNTITDAGWGAFNAGVEAYPREQGAKAERKK